MPPALLVHGRGGLGKTKIIKTLVHELGPANFQLMAPTGSSAKVLGGATFHSELMIRNEAKSKINALSSEDIAKLKMNFDGCKVVVLDEVSMVGSDMFHAIMSRLKDIGSDPVHPFGGFALIVLGDFFQMGPVQDTSLLKPLIDSYLSPPSSSSGHTSASAESAATKRAKKNKKPMATKDQEVALALRSLIRIELRPHENQRSRNDPDMEFLQTALRDTSLDFPVTDQVLNLLHSRSLSIQEAQQARGTPGRSSWRDGIMVLRNQTRRLLNRVFVTAFGKENGLPLFQFKNRIGGRFNSEVGDAFHAMYPTRLTTRLTIGTPVFITKNQAPADLGITNGTMGKVEGFVYNNPQDQDAFDAAVEGYFSDRSCIDANDIDASIISIPFPDRILVRVAGEDLAGLAILASSEQGREPGEDVIFPIQARNVKTTLNKTDVSIYEHDLEPAFALTNYKIQSQTRPNMTLDLVRAPGQAKICLRALYVGLTRTTSFSGIHILPDSSGAPANIDYLKKLPFDPYLRVFERAYDEDGRISGDRVRAAVRSGLLEKPQAKKTGAGHSSRPQHSPATNLAIQELIRTMQEESEESDSPPVVDNTSQQKPSRSAGKRPMSKQTAQQQAPSSSSSSDEVPLRRGRSRKQPLVQQQPSTKKIKASTPTTSTISQSLVGAHRWAGISDRGEKVCFLLNEIQHRWDFSCPIDATQFALASAAARSNVFRTLLESLHPTVATYLRALWSPWERVSDAQLRQLRHDAALQMITRKIINDRSRQASTRSSATVRTSGRRRNKVVSTFGFISDWLDCALPDRPFTNATLYKDFTCTSVLLNTICQRANVALSDLQHTSHRFENVPYFIPENGGLLQHTNELTTSWRNQFEQRRCGKKLEVAITAENPTATVSVTNVVTDMLTSHEHEAIDLGSDRLNAHPKGVVYTEDRYIGNHYTCGAPCSNNSKLVNFPALCILNTQGAPPGHPWIEQDLEISLEAPMQDGTHGRKDYALAAIVQHLPNHWTASYYDQRIESWFYHDGIRHGGYAQPCRDQASSIHTDADGFHLVYVKL